jgi:hypothetical protein
LCTGYARAFQEGHSAACLQNAQIVGVIAVAADPSS